MATLIINSGCANLASVRFALERLDETVLVSDDPQQILAADRVILPGVGNMEFAMQKLNDKGLTETINLAEVIKKLTCPVLGICLGMQMLFEGSSESNTSSLTPALGIIKGRAEQFPDDMGLSVPHMGWNTISATNDDPLLAGVDDGAYVYFVHSFYLPLLPSTIAVSSYGVPFTAVVRQDNFCGTQFHPERSSTVGAQILKNFTEL